MRKIAPAALIGTALALAASTAPVTVSTGSSMPAMTIQRNAVPADSSVRPLSPGTWTGWKLKFNATFTGTKLDTGVWATCYPWSPGSCTNFGNSDEYEWYLPSQVRVSGGALRLVAQRIATRGRDRHGNPKTYQCRSGMVTTYPSLRYQYGYLEVVARIPYAMGLWGALWLAPANMQWPPEIDIVEHWDNSKQIFQHLHPVNAPVQKASETTPDLSVGWHTFGLYWSRTQVIWFIDGKQVTSTRSGIPQLPMYFLADLALNRVPPNGTCTGTMLVRSVRLWQQS